MASLENGSRPKAQVSPLESRVAKRLDREKHPLQLEISLALGGHTVGEDANRFKEDIEKADIILAERVGWTKNEEVSFNDISQGKRSPHTVSAGPYWARFFELIENTRKAIRFLDIPDDEPLAAEGNRSARAIEQFSQSLYARSIPFEEGIEEYKKIAGQFVEINKKREEYIVSLADKKISQAVKNDPKLKTKFPIKVLVIFGAMHSSLYPEMLEMHPDTTRSFPTSPYIFNYAQEMRRRMRWGKEIDSEIVEKAFLEHLLTDAVIDLRRFEDRSLQNRFMRAVVDSFTPEELRTFYNLLVIQKRDQGAEDMLLEHLKRVEAGFKTEN
ncbi:MAG: hypothetical protein AB199_01920 [Parcubacteria bacterium C7867-004]|nr:MAG: hypothetical protein AB199_01920 [Parcubacteria bacterium C7867-004]